MYSTLEGSDCGDMFARSTLVWGQGALLQRLGNFRVVGGGGVQPKDSSRGMCSFLLYA